MAVPCGDQRDWRFAKHFGIEIKNIFKNKEINEKAYEEKDYLLEDSSFLNGLSYDEAIKLAMKKITEGGFGFSKINYRIRDAVFSRQRYWGSRFQYITKTTSHFFWKETNM